MSLDSAVFEEEEEEEEEGFVISVCLRIKKKGRPEVVTPVPDNPTYNVTSELTLEVSRSDDKALITCAVDHPSLAPGDKRTEQALRVLCESAGKWGGEVELSAEQIRKKAGYRLKWNYINGESESEPVSVPPPCGRGDGTASPRESDDVVVPTTYVWKKKDGELPPLAKVDDAYLRFEMLNKSDNGVYLCQADNGIGHSQGEYTLLILWTQTPWTPPPPPLTLQPPPPTPPPLPSHPPLLLTTSLALALIPFTTSPDITHLPPSPPPPPTRLTFHPQSLNSPPPPPPSPTPSSPTCRSLPTPLRPPSQAASLLPPRPPSSSSPLRLHPYSLSFRPAERSVHVHRVLKTRFSAQVVQLIKTCPPPPPTSQCARFNLQLQCLQLVQNIEHKRSVASVHRYRVRTYLTHEAKGSDDAPDADTAIINAEGGHSGAEDKKEYFI
ncbi:Cell adhesion molecule 3 [Collichthys lucidus]|uniref:Cell adhesion molecule 3 n=1 Tax=Collichthys lucidus TaxID=240159 RepID=A0A4U5UW68_COLLU|nr:Cell adhesion molecule 3 [Collichthys lucidus]